MSATFIFYSITPAAIIQSYTSRGTQEQTREKRPIQRGEANDIVVAVFVRRCYFVMQVTRYRMSTLDNMGFGQYKHIYKQHIMGKHTV